MGFIDLLLFHPEEHSFEGFCVEGDEGIEIFTLAVEGFVAQKKCKAQKKSCYKAVEIEKPRENEKNESQKFEGIAKLIISLRKICYGNKCTVKYYLGNEPTYLN